MFRRERPRRLAGPLFPCQKRGADRTALSVFAHLNIAPPELGDSETLIDPCEPKWRRSTRVSSRNRRPASGRGAQADNSDRRFGMVRRATPAHGAHWRPLQKAVVGGNLARFPLTKSLRRGSHLADVFISYKRTERARVERIAELLRAEVLDVWFDARLDTGSGEGFDAQIDREVTSAACVLVCWTQEALKSHYVRGEAMKGLERDVLRPAFLERCSLPVPFNVINTADLSRWDGDPASPDWKHLVASVKEQVDASKADAEHRRAQSRAAYERVTDQIFPETLTFLSQRIAAISDFDARDYKNDIAALLLWLASIAEKETAYLVHGYERADRQPGGDAWKFWDQGNAAARSVEVSHLRETLGRIEAALARSQELLNRPAP